jgi:hypothetical protein
MNDMDFKQLLKQQLPALINEDVEMRNLLVRAISSYFAGSLETESHFDSVLGEIRRDREEQSRKWDENKREMELDRQEQARKWDENKREMELDRQEQARKWDENKQEFDRVITQMELDRQEQARKWDEQTGKWNENRQEFDQVIAAIERMSRKHEVGISGLGARWGLCSESSFRNGLKAILEESFGVEVLNIVEYDDQGIVFGRPDQVELDLIIRNGQLIICEIKSSLSKGDLYTFYRKVDFYQQQHQRQATRKIVISPMVHPSANSIASKLGIEIYSYGEDVPPELASSPSL